MTFHGQHDKTIPARCGGEGPSDHVYEFETQEEARKYLSIHETFACHSRIFA